MFRNYNSKLVYADQTYYKLTMQQILIFFKKIQTKEHIPYFFFLCSKGNTALHEAVNLGPAGLKVIDYLLG